LGDKLTGNTTVITQTFNNAIVDPSQVRDATVSGIKYGDAVTISGVYRPGRILE
jgi:hypothetical protein